MRGRQQKRLIITVLMIGVVIATATWIVFIRDDGKEPDKANPTLAFERTATAIASRSTISATAENDGTYTAIAETLDVTGQGDEPTVSPTPSVNVPNTPGPEEGIGTGGEGGQQVASVNFEIISQAGENLGNGTVRLYSPSQMQLNESAEIIVELNLNLEPGVTLTNLPEPPTFTPTANPTITPTGGILYPTRTLPPIQGEGYVPVYEFMGAELLGVDRHNFRIEGVPSDGLLHIEPTITNRWRWSLRPLGEQAIGINRLEVQIYLPLVRSDGVQFRQETNLLPLQIEVVDGKTDKSAEGEGDSWLILIGVLGGAGALGGTGYWLRQKRRKGLRIFISYRRADSQGSAGRLYDRLARTFGKGLVFRDVEDIEYGQDFIYAIEEAVGTCDVLIAVIGTQWLSLRDAAGRRRLDNPHDFVHLEIATALRRGIRVIPTLVDDARMPTEADLPDDLKELHRRNAIAVRNDSFDDDVDRLVRSLLE